MMLCPWSPAGLLSAGPYASKGPIPSYQWSPHPDVWSQVFEAEGKSYWLKKNIIHTKSLSTPEHSSVECRRDLQ